MNGVNYENHNQSINQNRWKRCDTFDPSQYRNDDNDNKRQTEEYFIAQID